MRALMRVSRNNQVSSQKAEAVKMAAIHVPYLSGVFRNRDSCFCEKKICFVVVMSGFGLCLVFDVGTIYRTYWSFLHRNSVMKLFSVVLLFATCFRTW